MGGQGYDELCVAGLGGERDRAAILIDDALDDAEADACADAYGFGGVEGGEDEGLVLGGVADAVVADADAEIGLRNVWAGGLFLRPGANEDKSVLRYCFDGVVDQIG